MTRLAQVEAIFHEALKVSPEQVGAWLEARCAGDAELRREVSSLLAARRAMNTPSGFFPAGEAIGDGERVPPAPSRSDRLGVYRLETAIGSGGMGAVYRARREDGEFDQNVAIKVMGRHLAGPEFLASFRNERQLLAGLSHPNITRLLDGGVSSEGEPFLVMEYVEGEPIDVYCEKKKLAAAERIGLFLQIAAAVEYLHRNLIVHRDLKPANVLVTSDGAVKLLDFGTAKLLREHAPAATQARLLTPRYASPEQLRGEAVTTVSDVFSLGVMLYEMLTGAWPFGDPESAVDEMERVLRGRRPSQPSSVVTHRAAEERSASRERLQRELDGDLSTIVLKMLETEPARRYGSAREVAEDLERFRAGRPILARPQTAWYAARKFVARHWLAVAAATAAVAALAGLTIFSVLQSVEARRQAARAQRVSEFTKNMLLSASSTWASPLRGQSRAIQVTDILDNAAARAGQDLGDDPIAEADLRGAIGFTFAVLGDTKRGEAEIRRGLALLGNARGVERLRADLDGKLCDTLSFAERYEEALVACQSALAIDRVYPPKQGLSSAIHEVAFMSLKSGAPLEEAEKLFRQAAAGVTGPEAEMQRALYLTRVGSLRLRLGDLDQGRRILTDAERVLRAQPGPPVEIIPTLVALAYGARVSGDYATAVRYLDESTRILAERPAPYMGPEEIEIELAAALAMNGDTAGAAGWLKKLDVDKVLSEEAPLDRLRGETAAGIAEARLGRTESAERRLRSALAISQKEGVRQPADREEIYLRLAQLLAATHRAQEASAVAAEGLETARGAYGEFFAAHPMVKALKELSR